MSSVYEQRLPPAFPYRLLVENHRAMFLVGILVGSGCSFALTADAGPERRNLWLSSASRRVLIDEDQLTGVECPPIQAP